MPNNIAKNYYPVSQRFFQDLLSRFSPPLSSPSSNWAKKSTLPRWFNPLPVPFCNDLFAASPDFWERASGAWRRSQRPLCTSSFIPCGSKPIPFSFLLSMTPSPRRQGRKFQDVPGIEIILRSPISLVTNGSSLPCFIKTFFCLCGQNSIILKGPKDVDPF